MGVGTTPAEGDVCEKWPNVVENILSWIGKIGKKNYIFGRSGKNFWQVREEFW